MRTLATIGVTLFATIWAAVDAYAVSAPFVPDDPYFYTNTPAGFPGQWHLDKQSSGAVIDANVSAAWAKGWTGQGVRIGIVEGDFLQPSHPDLAANYSPGYDWPSAPTPATDSHATAVAGVAAGRGGNGIGTTGAAPFAMLSTLRVSLTNRNDWGTAARFRNDAIDIKNYSFGENFANTYGSILSYLYEDVAASEAAGTINVRCAMNDSYNANWYHDKNFFGQIVVGGIGSNGLRYEFSNYGANLTVTSPTRRQGQLSITTTDLVGDAGYNLVGAGEGAPDTFPDLDYTSKFSGTSSAAPLVSGILALAKEAQPALNTRFAKHLLARTSRMVDADENRIFNFTSSAPQLTDSSVVTPVGKWRTNAAGIHFNNDYGFGLIDAGALVDAAQHYVGVTTLVTKSTGAITVNQAIPEDGALVKTFTLGNLGPVEDMTFDYSITGLFKSSVEMVLTSPAGTVSLLHDAWVDPGSDGTAGTRVWTLLTNAFWGEDSQGTWTATIRDLPWNHPNEAADSIVWNSFGIRARIGSLIPAGPGDFDADRGVDGADFLAWQRDSSADFANWNAHFGEGPINSGLVPEPTGMELGAMVVAAIVLVVRRRQAASVAIGGASFGPASQRYPSVNAIGAMAAG